MTSSVYHVSPFRIFIETCKKCLCIKPAGGSTRCIVVASCWGWKRVQQYSYTDPLICLYFSCREHIGEFSELVRFLIFIFSIDNAFAFYATHFLLNGVSLKKREHRTTVSELLIRLFGIGEVLPKNYNILGLLRMAFRPLLPGRGYTRLNTCLENFEKLPERNETEAFSPHKLFGVFFSFLKK